VHTIPKKTNVQSQKKNTITQPPRAAGTAAPTTPIAQGMARTAASRSTPLDSSASVHATDTARANTNNQLKKNLGE
jgi:hypothetical protein